MIDSVSVEPKAHGHWAVATDWLAAGPVDAEIFVHMRDADGNLVTQADGPALGGMIPPWLWHGGDRIHDIRHIFLEDRVLHIVQVGLYNSQGRLPAYVDGDPCPDGVAPVATIAP